MITKGKDEVYCTIDLVRQTPGGERVVELDCCPSCLADCASYLNRPLHAITLVRSIPSHHARVVSTPPQYSWCKIGKVWEDKLSHYEGVAQNRGPT